MVLVPVNMADKTQAPFFDWRKRRTRVSSRRRAKFESSMGGGGRDPRGGGRSKLGSQSQLEQGRAFALKPATLGRPWDFKNPS